MTPRARLIDAFHRLTEAWAAFAALFTDRFLLEPEYDEDDNVKKQTVITNTAAAGSGWSAAIIVIAILLVAGAAIWSAQHIPEQPAAKQHDEP